MKALSFSLFIPFFWGFFAHKLINKQAVYSLPNEMARFYKLNSSYLEQNSVNPDKRRYVIKEEAPRHYIDLDAYDDSVKFDFPKLFWNEAKDKYSEDTLEKYGVVPWQIQKSLYQLTKAFEEKNARDILRLSADIGHYIADCHVPLHTTENYNGQLSNQLGIHAFWESRLPELYSGDYDLFVGPAEYIQNPSQRIWKEVLEAHLALDSVLQFEKDLSTSFSSDKKYTLEERNKIVVKNYSTEFSQQYNLALNNQVERQFRKSIKMVADLWFTAWVNAGQPKLNFKKEIKITQEEIEEDKAYKVAWIQRLLKIRTEN